jgi:3-hydroxymyristoyl/3-hydroxydecanoyl-(acyl carrier protein) dehydratase
MNDFIASDFTVPPDHPSLAGHFPGQPVVPAVILLDAVMAAIQARVPAVLESIPAAKFLQAVLADERIELRIQIVPLDSSKSRASFQGMRTSSVAFEGSFIVSTPTPAS